MPYTAPALSPAASPASSRSSSITLHESHDSHRYHHRSPSAGLSRCDLGIPPRSASYLHKHRRRARPAPDEAKLKATFYDDYVVYERPGVSSGKEKWKHVRVLEDTADGKISLQQETATMALRIVKQLPHSYRYMFEISMYTELSKRPHLFINFHGWYEDVGYIYLVMEYFEHGTLARYLEDLGPLAKPNAREITTQVLRGLKVMGDLRLYSNVGPQNVFISSLSPFHVKLGNFGYFNATPGTTGTYMAPEDLAPRVQYDMSSSVATNIWSMGCILYRILALDTPVIPDQVQYVDGELFNTGGHERANGLGDGISIGTRHTVNLDLLASYCRGTTGFPVDNLRVSGASESLIDFVRKLLAFSPTGRPSVNEALCHPWIKDPALGHQQKLPVTVIGSSAIQYSGAVWKGIMVATERRIDNITVMTRDIAREIWAVKKVKLDIYQARSIEYERELETLISVNENKESFVQFLGWYEHAEHINFVTEYADSGDMSQYLSSCDWGRDPSAIETATEIKRRIGEVARQILEGLVFLDEKGIYYYDFRPTNIIVLSALPIRVKLLLADYNSTIRGTHAYMAPEMVGILPPGIDSPPLATHAANMWSLACLVHKVVTAKDPFSKSDNPSPQRDSMPELDTSKLKQYCMCKEKLPMTTLDPSPMNERWTDFLEKILVPNPGCRMSAKQSLDSPLFRILRSINPYQWNVIEQDDVVVHRTNTDETTWKEIKRLHGGGMGTVFVMEKAVAERKVARTSIVVKRISKDFCISNNIDYTRELLTLVKLRDDMDLFVQFLGWYENRQNIHLAMEYIEHGDLENFLEKFGAQGQSNAKEISAQILEGLAFLHEREICHRDLKPQNVLVSHLSPVRVKLADFGLSKSTRDSKLNTNCGTHDYKAPELLGCLPPRLRPRRNAEYTIAVDIWSFGCLLHKILTLATPFLEKEEPDSESGFHSGVDFDRYLDLDLLKRFCRGNEDFPRDCLEEVAVSRDGIDFITKLLAPDPASRISASEALKDQWLRVEDNQGGTDAHIMRAQLSSLGVHISQRTAECLMKRVEGHHDTKFRTYLPSNILTNIRTLQYRASSAGYTLLLKTLLRIHVTYALDDPAIPAWTLCPRFPECADPIHDSCRGAALLGAAVLSGNIETVQLLLFKGQDVDGRQSETGARTALQLAAGTGNLKVLMLLLDNGSLVNAGASKSDGRTALQAAAEAGHQEVVKLLLERRADCNAPPSPINGRTALQAAATAGHLGILKELLENGAFINAEPCVDQGRTALQGAAEAGHLTIVNFLLDHGADVNSAPCAIGGRTALQAAAGKAHLEVLQLLLDHKADVNAEPSETHGCTALQAAAATGSMKAVQLLKSNGADMNAPPCSAGGRTALQAAAESGNLSVLTSLLQAGAEVDADPSEDSGRTALQAAAGAGHIEVVSNLLKHNADIDDYPAPISGRTALQAAAEGGHLEVVELLLNHEAEVEGELCKVGGRTALQAAAEYGHLEVVRALLVREADPNAQPCRIDGKTALHAAAENGHNEVVKLLLEYNADAEFGEGIAKQAASKNGHIEIAKLITEACGTGATKLLAK